MKEKLSAGQIVSVSLALFAMFFGAGNMIFPPMIGHLAGDSFVSGTMGFVVTDAGLSVIGIAAIVFAGSRLDDIGRQIGPKFSVFLGLVVYFLIGPLFALPRTGTVSYEMAVLPFMGEGGSMAASVIFTAVFFGVTYLLCANPSKIVDIVGKILTPILLISIAVIFVVSLVNPVGEISGPEGDYASIPFFKGFVEGYLALDGLAALAFGIVVITSIRNMGVKSDGGVAKYTLLSGVFAGLGLAVVYLMLAYVGAQTSGEEFSFENGGELLAAVVNIQMGKAGNIVLGLAVLMACLTTAIGLATSFADYISELKPSWSYKKVLAAVCLFSFAISNIGLTTMISVTLPALVMVYPPVVVLVLLTFLKKFINGKKEVYVLAMIMAFMVGIFDGLKNAGITEGAAFNFMSEYIPFFDLGVGWAVPALAGAVIGMLPFVRFMSHEQKKG